MKHLLIILSLLFLFTSPLFGKGEETGVLFERRVNGKFGWYKGGDEKKDWKYVGEIKNGKPNGQVTETSPDGRKYVGEFKNGKHHGQGIFTWGKGYFEGDRYDGEWKDGKYHGQGTYTWSNGRKYVGEYKDGEFHGQGTYTFTNGRKYVGEWKDGYIWNGKMYDKDGTIIHKVVNGKVKVK